MDARELARAGMAFVGDHVGIRHLWRHATQELIASYRDFRR